MYGNIQAGVPPIGRATSAGGRKRNPLAVGAGLPASGQEPPGASARCSSANRRSTCLYIPIDWPIGGAPAASTPLYHQPLVRRRRPASW
eukprot:1195397-Prorocentrum_minimum.AAC.2